MPKSQLVKGQSWALTPTGLMEPSFSLWSFLAHLRHLAGEQSDDMIPKLEEPLEDGDRGIIIIERPGTEDVLGLALEPYAACGRGGIRCGCRTQTEADRGSGPGEVCWGHKLRQWTWGWVDSRGIREAGPAGQK